MTTLQIILGATGAVFFLGMFVWIKSRPVIDRDCCYKVHGWWRKNWRPTPRTLGFAITMP
jgi:hypothetical protein